MPEKPSLTEGGTPVSRTILVADDDAHLVGLMAATLTKAGYEVLACQNGEEAMAILLDRPHAVDLIVLDMLMPKMDGLELTQALKANPSTAHIPIILCTGQGQETILQGLNLGGVDYITKPFNLKQLLLRVEITLNLHGSTERNA